MSGRDTPDAPDRWLPPFPSDATTATCPACKIVNAVRVHAHTTYADNDEYRAFCEECHVALAVLANVDIIFSDAEVVDE